MTISFVPGDDAHLSPDRDSARNPDADSTPTGRSVRREIPPRTIITTIGANCQTAESLTNFASGIVHELSNILVPIKVHVQLAQEKLDRFSPVQEYLAEALRSCHHGSMLLKQILTFSRREQPQRELADLRRIVGDAVMFLKTAIPGSVSVKVRSSDSLPRVLADETQIHQVILNLGLNAWHAMPSGTGTIEVVLDEITPRSDAGQCPQHLPAGGYARLSVRDDGEGMDEAILDRIFEPFFTTKSADKGTGLGLSVVRGIVESHGGAITVESARGRGTAFHIFLPAAD